MEIKTKEKERNERGKDIRVISTVFTPPTLPRQIIVTAVFKSKI